MKGTEYLWSRLFTAMEASIFMSALCMVGVAAGAGAIVSIGSPGSIIPVGSTFTVPVDINVGTTPLGTYTLEVQYDPDVITIDSIAGGDATEFSTPPLTDPETFDTGTTRFNGENIMSLDSPTGEVNVAKITFNAVHDSGNGSSYDLTVVTLRDTNAVAIPVDGIINGEVTTLVELLCFRTRYPDSLVLLEWQTDAEVGTAGFNALRAESAEGPWVRLNEDLIPSRGTSWRGASYAFSDETREAGTVYWYCIEEVGIGGETTRYPSQLVWDDGLKDADGDGMPDAWEQRLEIDTGSVADANTDADGDGAANLQEYLCGTSPVDAQDCPRLRIERDQGRNLIVMTWPGRPGRTYTLQSADSLAGLLGDSTTVLSVIQATSNRLIEFESQAETNTPMLFYRLIISPPR